MLSCLGCIEAKFRLLLFLLWSTGDQSKLIQFWVLLRFLDLLFLSILLLRFLLIPWKFSQLELKNLNKFCIHNWADGRDTLKKSLWNYFFRNPFRKNPFKIISSKIPSVKNPFGPLTKVSLKVRIHSKLSLHLESLHIFWNKIPSESL